MLPILATGVQSLQARGLQQVTLPVSVRLVEQGATYSVHLQLAVPSLYLI